MKPWQPNHEVKGANTWIPERNRNDNKNISTFHYEKRTKQTHSAYVHAMILSAL